MTTSDLCLFCCCKLPPQIETDDDYKHLISTNLSVIFLMRNLLQVPSAELQLNLSECGNPGNWITLCDICSNLAKEAEEIHCKIIKFQQDLRSIQHKLVNKVKSSSTEDKCLEQGFNKTDRKDEENTKRKTIWRKTREFIQTNDRIPLCSPFIEGDKLADQLVNQVISRVPEIKREVEDDSCSKNENENDVDWKESYDEMDTGINSDSDSNWSVTTTTKLTKNNLDQKKKRNSSLTLRCRKLRTEKTTASKDKWECQYCDQVFNCRGTRGNHQRNKHPTNPGQHICHICQRACDSHHLLLMHLRGAHKMKADGSPAPPKKVYKKPKDVKVKQEKGTPLPRRERRKHEKGMKWECRHCDKVFNHRTTCESHEKSKHPLVPGQHVCNICDKACNSNHLLLMHKRKTHGIRADGTPIPPKTNKIPNKTEKIPPITVPKFECRYCDKVFYHRGTRNGHHLAKHPVIPGQHICELCGKGCNSKGYLLVHKRQAHNMKSEGELVLPLKKKKVRISYHLERKDKFVPISCGICGVTLRSPGSYRNHMRFSHEKRYKDHCNSCGMGFMSSTAFKMHLLAKHKEDEVTKRLVEEGTRIWKCEVYGCPAKFMRKESLESHAKRFHSLKKIRKDGSEGKVEETAKRFTCAYCGKGFWGGAKLRRHELTHEFEGTKDFKCELCGSGFITMEHLKKHQNRVHKIFVRKRSN